MSRKNTGKRHIHELCIRELPEYNKRGLTVELGSLHRHIGDLTPRASTIDVYL